MTVASPRDGQAMGFAAGAAIVSLAALAIGQAIPPEKDFAFDLPNAALAGLAGAVCGFLLWRYKAGRPPMTALRAAVLAGVVALAILFCAFLGATAQWAAGAGGSAFEKALTLVLVMIVVYVALLAKFAVQLLGLMVGWALVWRVVVNRWAARMARQGDG